MNFILVLEFFFWKHRIALFTVETKYIATAYGTTQTLWSRHMFGITQHKNIDHTKIYCDGKSTIKLSKNLVHHGPTSTWISNINLYMCCRIEEQVTNIFTKALKTEKMLGISKCEEFGLREAIHGN